MRGATKELLESSNLDGEQLQIAIRVAHNNLKDKRRNFDEFVNEGAHSRIIQYSYLHLLFAQVIVMPDLNTWFLQWIDWIGVSAKFNLAWHYAWGGRGGFERIWTGPAAGVGRDGRAAARRCGHS